MHRYRRPILVSLLLVLLTLAAYRGIGGQGFVIYDDPGYVSQNGMVRQGLTLHGVAYAFTAAEASYWHPITWLSHMLDCQLFGLEAGRHKQVSLFIHCLNTLLLLALLRQLTGSFWRSAVVATLFAIHPLNVESVAWIAERKTVLSTFFGLLTILAYVGYVRRPAGARYGLALALYALCLMAKPMLVTLPFVLLLLDFWPLRRWEPLHGSAVRQSLLEKVPFFVLSVASCVVTFFTNRHLSGAWMDHIPFSQRLANAVVSYGQYLGKVFWPTDLVCIYPQRVWGAGPVLAVGVLLVAITAVAVRLARQSPALLIGWLWFLGTLVPTLNLVTSGPQAMADRYAYVPLIGLFVAIVFSLPAPPASWSRGLTAAACCVVVALAIHTHDQVGYWHDTQTLFTHAVERTDRNYVALACLATDLSNHGDYDRAEPLFRESLRIEPRYPFANTNEGFLLLGRNDFNGAAAAFRRSLKSQPEAAPARLGLAEALDLTGDWLAAVAQYEEAIRLRPRAARFMMGYAIALLNHGDVAGAVVLLEHAAVAEPDQQAVRDQLAAARRQLPHDRQTAAVTP